MQVPNTVTIPYTADMRYTKECIDYKKLRKHDYYSRGRMMAICALSTPKLVEYFVRSLADSYPDLNFNMIDQGNFDIAVECEDQLIYRGSYLDVELLFRQSSDLFLDILKDKVANIQNPINSVH